MRTTFLQESSSLARCHALFYFYHCSRYLSENSIQNTVFLSPHKTKLCIVNRQSLPGSIGTVEYWCVLGEGTQAEGRALWRAWPASCLNLSSSCGTWAAWVLSSSESKASRLLQIILFLFGKPKVVLQYLQDLFPAVCLASIAWLWRLGELTTCFRANCVFYWWLLREKERNNFQCPSSSSLWSLFLSLFFPLLSTLRLQYCAVTRSCR